MKMTMSTRWLLAALALVTPASLRAQELAQVCQSLDKLTVGQWGSYSVTSPRRSSGKVRLAIVGSERRADTTMYWFEITGAGAGSQGGIVQLLVTGFGAEPIGVRAMVMKLEGQPAMKMPDQMVAMWSERAEKEAPALEIGRRCRTAQAVGWETITVPAGAIRALHVKNTDGGEAWLTAEVPFGIVKALPKEGGEMVLTGRGADAKSSITERPQELPGMMNRP